MVMSNDPELVTEIRARLADRYTAAELCDLLDVDVWDIIYEYWEKILENEELIEEYLYNRVT